MSGYVRLCPVMPGDVSEHFFLVLCPVASRVLPGGVVARWTDGAVPRGTVSGRAGVR